MTKEERHLSIEEYRCEMFNLYYPVGTRMLLKDDFGKMNLISVNGHARIISGHACAWATKFGCYLLNRFRPIKYDSPIGLIDSFEKLSPK